MLGWDPTKYSASFGVGEPNANCEAKLMEVKEDRQKLLKGSDKKKTKSKQDEGPIGIPTKLRDS